MEAKGGSRRHKTATYLLIRLSSHLLGPFPFGFRKAPNFNKALIRFRVHRQRMEYTHGGRRTKVKVHNQFAEGFFRAPLLGRNDINEQTLNMKHILPSLIRSK